MDTLRLEVATRYDPAAGPVDALDVFVNGRDLRDLAREAEIPFARREGKPQLAGDYAGLPPGEMFYPSRRLLGEPETYYDADGPSGKLAVLGCPCGDPGCRPLVVEISARDDVVVWEGFEQPHRKGWDHSDIGPFVFDRDEYETALLRG